MSNPIPLTDPNGTVRAWMCGCCNRVGLDEERAGFCCTCLRCGKVARFHGSICDECDEKARARDTAMLAEMRKTHDDCGRCGGYGWIDDIDHNCQKCDGTGWIKREEPQP